MSDENPNSANRPLNAEEVAAALRANAEAKAAKPGITDVDNETARKLLEDLSAYHAAIESEFADTDGEDPETAGKVREHLFKLVPDAGTTIKYLLNHADSESVRANLAKFVYAEAMRTAKAEGDEDGFGKLLRELRGEGD